MKLVLWDVLNISETVMVLLISIYMHACVRNMAIWYHQGTRTSTCEKTNWGKPFWNALILQETTCHLFQLHTWGSASDVRRVFTELKQKHTVTGNWPVGIDQWEKHLKGRAFVFLKIGNICHDTWCWDGFSKKSCDMLTGRLILFWKDHTARSHRTFQSTAAKDPTIQDYTRMLSGGLSPFPKNKDI